MGMKKADSPMAIQPAQLIRNIKPTPSMDGFVKGNETSLMVCVLSGECQLTDCAAGDFNGDPW